jgi:hypothetical protein
MPSLTLNRSTLHAITLTSHTVGFLLMAAVLLPLLIILANGLLMTAMVLLFIYGSDHGCLLTRQDSKYQRSLDLATRWAAGSLVLTALLAPIVHWKSTSMIGHPSRDMIMPSPESYLLQHWKYDQLVKELDSITEDVDAFYDDQISSKLVPSVKAFTSLSTEMKEPSMIEEEPLLMQTKHDHYPLK